jgi:hypothetical protein
MAEPTAQELVQGYNIAKLDRSPLEDQWRKNAAYVQPRDYGLWQTQNAGVSVISRSGAADTSARIVYDATAMKSLPIYSAVLNRLSTPGGQRYHSLQANNTDLMRVRAVKIYFSVLTERLFAMRNEPRAFFRQAQGEMYGALGVYGTAPKTVMWRREGGGFGYKSWHLRDIFITVDDEGRLRSVFRRMMMSVLDFKSKWPGKSLPAAMQKVGEDTDAKQTRRFEFFHHVCPQSDYDSKAIDYRRHKLVGYYVCVEGAEMIGKPEGFISMPYIVPRTETISGDPYGYSPAERAFPAIGGASATKKTVIKQGHKSLDPTMLANDDGALGGGIDTRPGKVIWGGLNAQGQELIKPLQVGANFNVAETILQDDRKDIQDIFLVSLFQLVMASDMRNPQKTAAQVYEEIGEKAAIVDPTMGRLQSEDQGPQIEREIALLVEHGLMPEMPPEMIEAQGEYQITYASPFAKLQNSERASGYMRLKESAIAEATATGDQSILDHFNNDVAIPEIADIMSVPPTWMADAKQLQMKREGRAQQQQTENLIKAAPSMASVAKASMDKAGGQQRAA